jgi:GAF domain-containing protein/CheY-like chemotaxis protein
MKVLVVDDSATSRKYLRTLLAAEGYTVLEAEDGQAALEILEREKIDGVISDILMPRKDGYRLCHDIRQNKNLRTIPFIAYTASYVSPADAKVALDFGADRFLTKPAPPQAIVTALRESMENKQARSGEEADGNQQLLAMREYSEALVRKLEEKNVELAEANRALHERAALAEFTAALSTVLTESTSLQEMLQRCAEAMIRNLQAGLARIWTLNEKDNVLELQASAGLDTRMAGAYSRLAVGRFEIGLIVSERKPHVTNSVIGDPRIHDQEWAKRERMVAFAGYPLMIRDRMLGVMAVFSRKPFTDNSLLAMSSAGNGIALAIERKKSEEQLHARYRELQTLQEISQSVLDSLDLDQILDGILERTMALGAFDTGVVCLMDNATDVLKTVAFRGYRDPQNVPPPRRPADESQSAPTITHALVRNEIQVEENVPTARRMHGAKKEGLRSTIAVPVRTTERVLGVLHLGSRTPRKFQPEEARLLESIGNNVGIAVQKALLHRETTLNLDRIRALHEIELAISSTLDPQKGLDVLLEKIDVFLPFPAASTIRLFNPVTKRFDNTACRNIDEQEWKAGTGREMGQVSGEFIRTKGPVIIRDLQTNTQRKTREFFRRHGFASYLGVPLIAKGNVVGILGFYTREVHEFTQQDIDFLTTLAGQAAIAIDSARLHEQTERHLKRIEALNDIDNAITSTLSLDRVLTVLLEKIEPVCPIAVAAGVRLRDKATGKLIPIVARNIPLHEWRAHVESAKGLLSRQLVNTRAPITILNMLTDSRTSLHDFARKYGLVSYLGVPLIVKDEFMGNLVIYTKEEHPFGAEEIEFFTALAGQAAIAIDNARLYEEAERRRREAEELARVARSLTETLDITAVGQRIALSVRELFGVRGSTLRLIQADGSFHHLASSGEVFSQTSEGRTVPSGIGITGRSVAEGRPIWSQDVLNDPAVVLSAEMRSYQIQSGNSSMIAVPLRAHEKLIGALTLSDRTGRSYSDGEVGLLQTFANQAALALQNARLYEEAARSRQELETTNQYLQRSLQQLGGLYTALAPIAAATSIQEMMGEIIDRLIDATGADATLIRTWDRNAGVYPIIGQRGYSDDYLNRTAGAMGGATGGAVDWVVTRGEPVITPDIASDARLKAKLQLELGLKSCAILPLKIHDEVRGVIQLSSRTSGYFDEEQRDHLIAIARQMSIALENHDLFESLKSSRDELARANAALQDGNRMLSALHAVAAAASQSMELDRVLHAAIEKITEVFFFDATQIHIYNAPTDELNLRAAFAHDPARFSTVRSFKRGQGIVGKVAETGTSLIFDDVGTDPRYRQMSRTQVSAQHGYRFFAVFPIKGKLKNLGTLACVSAQPRQLTSGEIQLLEALADQLAVAIENSELYDAVRKKVDELQQKTFELEQANKGKDEFLSVISHELRTPLNVIMGYTGVLAEEILGPIGPEQRDALNRIAYQSSELLMMVERILDATMLESEYPNLANEEVFLPTVLREIRTNCVIPAQQQVELSWNCAADLPAIRTDGPKLKHILENLIHNAIKFTQEGNVTVSAKYLAEGNDAGVDMQLSGSARPVISGEPTAAWLQIEVADTGAGIPDSALPLIFDKFYQVDSSATRQYGGVGLGLYIVKRFTALLGGSIKAESKPGEGSTFTLRLPLSASGER